jgi:glycosyltransferase involved in cell wall biosynthesis
MPTVSIITPAKNAARWIGGTIASVRAQTYQDWEMVVVDDGSTDGTLDVARVAAQGDPRVVLHRSQGTPGAGGARNAALDLATGRFIAFLDADDLWDAGKLEQQIGAMLANRWCFSWTSYRIQGVSKEGVLAEPPFVERTAWAQATRRDVLSKRAPIGCLTAIYDTAFFGKVPMENIAKRQDFVLWMALMAKAESEGWAMGGVVEPLATYRHRRDSLSANKLAAARMQWKALVEHCNVSRLDAAWLFASFMARGLADKWSLIRHARTKSRITG